MNERGLHDLTEDTTGFGRAEVRTLWHSLRQPVGLLDSYMSGGPTGGGQYARPLRLYLTLCGILMVIQFLMGGLDAMLAGMLPAEDLEPLLQQSGKSYDAFMADVDGWGSFFTVPLLAVAYAFAIAPLLRWWDPEDLGWRRSFRATFAYLNLWTLLMMPIGWMVYVKSLSNLGGIVIIVLGLVAFVMMGKGRWWRTLAGAFGKAVVLGLVSLLAGGLVSIPLSFLAVLGGIYGP